MACSGNSCSVILGGNGSARVLGTTVSLQFAGHGRAILRVADRDISCTEGQTVSAGPLMLTCTAVTPEEVRFSARRDPH